MKFYPAYLELHGRPCLIIGGGAVAERKALSLIDAGAQVSVLSPTATPNLLKLARSGSLVLLNRSFEPADINNQFLVIAATDSEEVNIRAARICKQRNILVNVIAPPEESTFIVPSVVDRGDLLIALSTSGVSPALSHALRRDLEMRYGPEYAEFLHLLAPVRRHVLETIEDEQERRRIFQAIADSDILDRLRQGDREGAEQKLKELAGV
jgi:precorrin-2 dehydrogenase / sirohydrochlorin ferrochelatase